MQKAIFPGTFDPPTVGHQDLIRRAGKLSDFLYLSVAQAHHKKTLFTLEERKKMLELTAAEVLEKNKFTVITFDGLLIDLCRKLQTNVVIRGLRDSRDFEYERRIGGVNQIMFEEFETVYLQSYGNTASISSEILREVIKLNGNTEKLLPKSITDFVREKIINKTA
ncbi:MAG: pantetheine-phosphate adenylyltransferase [Cardiobacteriaceae bacterium]|nr:pantetheine-phosphate adenylyltransferase [Cardiobacteriaceae bacterium]